MARRADEQLHFLRLNTTSLWSLVNPQTWRHFPSDRSGCVRADSKGVITSGAKMVLGRQETVRRLSSRQESGLGFSVPVVCEAIAGNSGSLQDSSRLGGI